MLTLIFSAIFDTIKSIILKNFYKFIMYLWAVAALVTAFFAAFMIVKANTTKSIYLLLLAFFCGVMFMLNKKRINNFKD